MKKVVNIKSEKKSKIDIAVLMIFFSRDKQFGQVFEQVALARPSILYLYHDGMLSELKSAEKSLIR
mgnify:CR=1 FL=1